VALADLAAAGQVRWGAAVTLVLASLAVMGSPGPATISLTAAGSAYGLRPCARYLAGIITGTVGVLAVVAAGITSALLAVPGLRVALIVLSAAYIVWLAYRIATAPPATMAAAATRPPSLVGGILLGIANPKAWLAISAVFASARLAVGPVADAVAKTVALTLMIILICTAWLAVGASLAAVFRDPRRSRIFNIALSVLLVAATAATVARQVKG